MGYSPWDCKESDTTERLHFCTILCVFMYTYRHTYIFISLLDFKCMFCHCCCLVAKSCQLFCNPMDCSWPGSLSMGFTRQEYWRELPFPPPGDLPNSGIEPRSSELQLDSSLSEPQGKSMFCHMLLLSSLYVHAQSLSHS